MFTAVAAVFLLLGCAEKGPILLSVGYLPPAEKAGIATKGTIGVSLFKDNRGKPASTIGKRTITSGLEDDFVVQGTVAELVTARFTDALKTRGSEVKNIEAWDLTPEGIRGEGVNVVISGEIKTLWLESVSVPFKTNLKAAVQLRIVAGDPVEKKILRAIEVNSKLEQDVMYSREKLEGVLSEALSSALDQIFRDDELKKRLQ